MTPGLAGIDDIEDGGGAERIGDEERIGGGDERTGAEALGEAVRLRTISSAKCLYLGANSPMRQQQW